VKRNRIDRGWTTRAALAGALPLVCALALACVSCKDWRGEWVAITVENQTGQTVRQLEVDYPSAGFGVNSLAPGASMHYRFQILGSGPVKVDYTTGDGKSSHSQGLTLVEHQHGTLSVRLLPMGKVEFVPNLQPAS
jgi:hypothetical protein